MNVYVKAMARALLEDKITSEDLLAALEMCFEYGTVIGLFAPESSQRHLDQETRVHIAKDILRRHIEEQVGPVSEELLNWLIALDEMGFPMSRLEPKGIFSN